jgi:farnesyl-diphosphate farnesyltransferase
MTDKESEMDDLGATSHQLSDAHTMVRSYSTTWYEPIMKMPARLNEACTGTYLMLRAIDEIEDHPNLSAADRAALLRNVSIALQTQQNPDYFAHIMRAQEEELPDVTCRLAQWRLLIPPDIAPRVYDVIATMADRMAEWVLRDFHFASREDLDRYTYAVGSSAVLVFSDLASWYDGAPSHRTQGVALGRFLQAVNILIDRANDAERGVDMVPAGWQLPQMIDYVHEQEADADAFVDGLGHGPARDFFEGPHRRAHKALRLVEASTAAPESG